MSILPKHQRLFFVAFSVVMLIASAIFAMQAFRANMVYFYSSGDINASPPADGSKLRIGGLVKTDSLQRENEIISFIITDGNYDVKAVYRGILPNLFREGQGVIAEGIWQAKKENSSDKILGTIIADKILAKHDERYMPKEVVDSLKRSGHWK